MAGQQQHVDMHRKVLLRRHLLDKLGPIDGDAFVPFCGDGDLTAELEQYGGRRCLLADVDPDRVGHARGRFGPDVYVETADVDTTYVPPPPSWTAPTFVVADFDAYAYPYAAFRLWFDMAPLGDRLAVWFTDGARQAISRTGSFELPDGERIVLRKGNKPDKVKTRPYYNGWWAKYVKPWFVEYVGARGWQVVETEHYLRGIGSLYWGAVLERTGSTPAAVPRGTTAAASALAAATATGRKGKGGRFDDAAKAAVVGLVTEGQTVEEAATACGFSARTVRSHAGRDSTFRDALDVALAASAALRDRASRFTEDARAEYLEQLRQGKRRMAAARAVHVAPRTVREYAAEHPDYKAAMIDAEREGDEEVEDALRTAAISGNVTAAQVWLYNRQPDVWRDRRNVGGLSDKPDAPSEPVEVGASGEDIWNLLRADPQNANLVQHVSEAVARQRAAGEE